LPAALRKAASAPWELVTAEAGELLTAATRREKVEVAGPIGIVRFAAKTSKEGFWDLASFLALLVAQAWPLSIFIEAALAPRPAQSANGFPIAGRDRRLFAYAVDLLVTAVVGDVCTLPGAIAGSETLAAVGLAVGVVTLLVFQAYLLAVAGQTIGKRVLGLRIVRRDGRTPGFVRVVLLRALLPALLTALPGIGAVVLVLDTLAIFTNRGARCLHDYVAGTWVARDGVLRLAVGA
jgi:uncharacterized RDD family membrane protein YckC